MSSATKTCMELLQLVERHEETIANQNDIIKRLTMITMEQEAVMHELMQGDEGIHEQASQ